MFLVVLCSSSGGQIVCKQHLVLSLSKSGRGGRAVHRLRENSLNQCTAQPPWPLIESDDTICCIHTIWPPEDEHNTARNMWRTVTLYWILRENSLNPCNAQPPWPLIESDDTICCIHSIWPPEDEHNTARNMYRTVTLYWIKKSVH
jgi:hypothetical protein